MIFFSSSALPYFVTAALHISGKVSLSVVLGLTTTLPFTPFGGPVLQVSLVYKLVMMMMMMTVSSFLPCGRRTPVVEYLIKWAGYASHESTREPASNMEDSGSEVQRMLRAMDRLAQKQRRRSPAPQHSAQPSDNPYSHGYSLRPR